MAHRLMKREGFSMQCLTWEQFEKVFDKAVTFAEGECAQGGSSVGFIAQNLVAEVLHVCPDLMGSSRVEGQGEHRKPVEVFRNNIVRNGRFPVFSLKRKVCHHFPVFF